MFFLDELDNFMIFLINNKVIKWIEIKIDMIENDIWVNICFKFVNIIYNEKNLNIRNRNKNGVYYRIYFLEDKMLCCYLDLNWDVLVLFFKSSVFINFIIVVYLKL